MKPRYILRHMQMDDIPQVSDIDQASFSTPWPRRTYEHEIENRNTAQMIVLEYVPSVRFNPSGLWSWLRHWHLLPFDPPPSCGQVVGYGGCWLIAGEAHISTIAVHPDFRGLGLGEALLMGMLQRAINLQADYSVLEVRISNDTAQALYRKYEYEVVGRRRRYYRDDGEDAYLMEARPLDQAYLERLNQRAAELKKHLNIIDQFTSVNDQPMTEKEL